MRFLFSKMQSLAKPKWIALLVVFHLAMFTAMWMFGSMFSCATPVEESPTGEDGQEATAKTFPHSKDWGNWFAHGRWVTDNGSDGCVECHGQDLAGGWSGVSCTQCHETYPHPEGFDSPTAHGHEFLEVGPGSCATYCHGQDWTGGDSGVSCFQCHGTFPHSEDWSDISQHGVHVDKNGGPDTCATHCHGEDLGGADSGVSCTQCHKNYPHVPDWKNQHDDYIGENGFRGCATECHGEDYHGGVSGVSCKDCHVWF